MNNIKIGAIMAYSMVVLNSIYALIITPYILGVIGEMEYGVYKTISSFSSSLLILDLGIGGTVIRYVAKYRAQNKQERISNFISMIFGETVILILIVAMVCFLMYFTLSSVYSSGLDYSQIELAERLYIILSINLLLHLIENVLYGIISGYNQFVFSNGLKNSRIILRIICTYVFLSMYKSSIALVIIDLGLTVFLITADYVYIKKGLRVTIAVSFKNWEKDVWLESFRYTVLMFLTSVAAQVNSNLDNVVIGIELGASEVAIYSMGLVIFSMFQCLSTGISGVMLPTITNSLSHDPSGRQAKEIIIASGRIQFILLGGVLAGFIIMGKKFIHLWLGSGYDDVYIIVLLLMGPSLLELCVNVCLSVLRAKNMIGFRTMILMVTTLINAFVTVFGVREYGYFAAAIGTGISFLFGSVFVMNIYYYIKLHYNMLEVYGHIFNRTWLCIITSSLISVCLPPGGVSSIDGFLYEGTVFCVIYFVTLMVYGFNRNEKKQVKQVLWRIIK
ncbi:lipopolysaccharide biosynthesis protein [Selenomonas ruminantium]|nr:oligosaccharide flippase family protein [Selenomonas ruminantium]